jgi:hypothetical protein
MQGTKISLYVDNNESRITDILSLNILERVKTLLEASSAPQLQVGTLLILFIKCGMTIMFHLSHNFLFF